MLLSVFDAILRAATLDSKAARDLPINLVNQLLKGDKINLGFEPGTDHPDLQFGYHVWRNVRSLLVKVKAVDHCRVGVCRCLHANLQLQLT